MKIGARLGDVSRKLSESLADLPVRDPVTHVYDPTQYARELHERYLAFARQGAEGLLLGMNPGPWGMAQTGVPFGEVGHVRDFLRIEGKVDPPQGEHPKRPVKGLACARSEVSGRRLWSWAAERFGTADKFFDRFFVWNWCPLAFLEATGRNRTPDKLPSEMRSVVEPACDAALREVVEILRPTSIVAVGTFAERRATVALKSVKLPIHRILHPSPASPAANRGWAEQVDQQFARAGFSIPVPTSI